MVRRISVIITHSHEHLYAALIGCWKIHMRLLGLSACGFFLPGATSNLATFPFPHRLLTLSTNAIGPSNETADYSSHHSTQQTCQNTIREKDESCDPSAELLSRSVHISITGRQTTKWIFPITVHVNRVRAHQPSHFLLPTNSKLQGSQRFL